MLVLVLTSVLPGEMLQVHEKSVWQFVPKPSESMPSAGDLVVAIQEAMRVIVFMISAASVTLLVFLISQVAQLSEKDVKRYLQKVGFEMILVLPYKYCMYFNIKVFLLCAALKTTILYPWSGLAYPHNVADAQSIAKSYSLALKSNIIIRKSLT